MKAYTVLIIDNTSIYALLTCVNRLLCNCQVQSPERYTASRRRFASLLLSVWYSAIAISKRRHLLVWNKAWAYELYVHISY